jgi:hypothetical protein
VGGNADEVGQRLEGIQAEVMMDHDWPELYSECPPSFGPCRRSSGWFALISDAIVEYPEPWKQSISVSMPDLRPSRHQILLYPTKKGDVGDGHEDSRSAVD